MNMKKVLSSIMITGLLSTALVGCGGQNAADIGSKNEAIAAKNLTVEQIIEEAKKEGQVVSVGMPDSWANWKGTWEDINKLYGLEHTDTDMSSSEEIAKFEAEKNNPTADIGDVGWSFGPVAEEKGVTIKYKTSYWDQIPDWAKDDDGDWMLGYTGSLAIMTNKKLIKNPPKSFQDILEGDYKVSIGTAEGTQTQNTILAAAFAFGGDETNIQPGIDFFAELAKQGRLLPNNNDLANIENGEVAVTFLWDFNALNYRDIIDKDRFDVCIPMDASVRTGYTTIINKYAPHPHAAMLAREYILSDEGQINLAIGYAKPIRSDVVLPAEIQAKLLPEEQYKSVKNIEDRKAWEETSKTLNQLWQEQVLVHIN
ncbi:extracellular solute-binding protein [Clostridiaceae bacterium 35-E11]